MQRFSLFLGLVVVSVTLGLLWRTEDAQQPLALAEMKIELPPHLEQLLFEIPHNERDGFLRQFKQAQDNPTPRQVRIIKVNENAP